MLYIANIKKRYFDLMLKDGAVLKVAAPSFRDISELEEIETKATNKTVNDLINLMSNILSNNQQEKEITPEYIIENFDYDQIAIVIGKYIEWVRTGLQDPN